MCLAPGSRSAPLALMIASHEQLRSWMHIDERSAGFFALGLARALNEPVALVCTSGTAAANFLPAVVEAHSANVPLIVLTADRPPEMRDTGAAQTIDQNRLFGAHSKWFVDVALPEATADMLRYVRTLAVRATAQSAAVPAGPVHLNFPFREPLVPVPHAASRDVDDGKLRAFSGRKGNQPWVRVSDSALRADPAVVERLAAQIQAAQRPLIVCGPQPDVSLAGPLAMLSLAARAPLLADPLSQVRWGGHDRTTVIDRYDAILRDDETRASLAPDLIIRVAGVPTSKSLMQYLSRHSDAPLVVINSSRWPDPTLLADEMVHADPRLLAEDLLGLISAHTDEDRNTDEWLERWRAINSAAGSALAAYSASLDEPFEGQALADVVASLPEGATLFVSSSMPVRDLDAFGAGDTRDIRIMSNRGANGIDGVVSTALGAAAGARSEGGGPIVLVIGDLALYHDMNGLLAARLHALSMTIVLLNNDGGGIFSFLPQADHPAHFEKLFGTPHGLDFSHVGLLYGARFSRAGDSGTLRQLIAEGIDGGGLHMIEVRTDRARNVELHRDAWKRVAAAVRGI